MIDIVEIDNLISELEVNIRTIEDYEYNHFLGWKHAVESMKRSIEFLQKYKEVLYED